MVIPFFYFVHYSLRQHINACDDCRQIKNIYFFIGVSIRIKGKAVFNIARRSGS